MKITRDGFIYKIVTNKAEQLYKADLFSLFILFPDDDSEALIESAIELQWALDNNLPIGIEVGKVETNDAKEILANEGYYSDNLWSVYDVTDKFDCNKEQAYKVLDSALRNEATMDQIHFAINDKCSIENYLEKE